MQSYIGIDIDKYNNLQLKDNKEHNFSKEIFLEFK